VVEVPEVQSTVDGGAVVTVAKVRKAKVYPTMKIPAGEFLRDDFAELNGFDFNQKIYLRIKAPYLISLTSYWGDDDFFISKNIEAVSFSLFYSGAILLLCIYHLMLFVAFRRLVFLYYCLFALGMLSVGLSAGGVLDLWFPSEKFSWGDVAPVTRVFPALFVGPFLTELFHLKGRQFYSVLGIGITAIFLGAIIAVGGSQFALLSDALNGVALTYMFYLGWKMFRQKTPGSRSYLLGLFCLASGVGYWTIGNLGWVQRNLWAIHAPILGNLLEIVFLSATLSSSLETFRKAEANEKAATERVDFLKRFIRVLTHDLANPLAIIQGSLRQLLQQKDPVVLKNAQRIERASSQMKGLIDNIRTIQALQSGKLEIKPTSVSLRQAVDNAIFTVSELSEKKNVPVQVIDFSQDLNILADPSSLSHEVLSNLLSNAIKFTEPGETISITVEALENHVLLHIQDRGIGILILFQELCLAR
jgi:adenylate cyclase